MKEVLERKLRMYSAVRTLLRDAGNQALWLDNPPFLTQRVTDFEAGAAELGAFGSAQSQTLTGATQQQNLAETSLEDAAFPLGRALRLYFRQQSQLDQAAPWNLTLTQWREMPENVLLEKARALHAAALPLTQGANPSGAPFGLTTAKATALDDLIDDYAAVIGAPIAARSDRKAKTSALRPRFRVVDGLLEDMDDLILALRGESPAHDLFVDAYFNARRIGGHSSTAPAAPAPPTP